MRRIFKGLVTWKDIKGFEGKYQVNELGEIKSFLERKVKILNPVKMKNGYLKVILRKDKKSFQRYVHRLVAQSFLVGDGVVNHLDGNKYNNNLKNLEFTDHSGNLKHAWDIGLQKKKYKLKPKEVDKIRGLFALGINASQISKIFNLPSTPVYWVCQKRTWNEHRL